MIDSHIVSETMKEKKALQDRLPELIKHRRSLEETLARLEGGTVTTPASQPEPAPRAKRVNGAPSRGTPHRPVKPPRPPTPPRIIK